MASPRYTRRFGKLRAIWAIVCLGCIVGFR